ncbi:MAG: hypothetical protein R3190_03040 [Thermoanaerobaculia bacterium]|nr:hypothetical protein [Thermoanaerobaculia bacterium]
MSSRYFMGLHHLFAVHEGDWKLIYHVPYESLRNWRPSRAERAAFPAGATPARALRVVNPDEALPNPVELPFGDTASLVGWRVRRSAERRDYLYVDLYWRADNPERGLPHREVRIDMGNGRHKSYLSLIADGDVPGGVWQRGAVVRETLWAEARSDFDLVLHHVFLKTGGRVESLANGRTGGDRHHRLGHVKLSQIEVVERAAPHGGRPALHDWPIDDPSITVKLFDLGADPQERHNLYWLHPQEARRLEGHLAAWREEVASHPGPSSEAGMSDETIEKMRSLGYLN